MAILKVEGLSVRFGGIVALDRVSLAVKTESICGVIGPNGAGKTTLFNCLSRLYTPLCGSIEFNTHDLLALPAHKMAAIGIGRTFQNLALFRSMTVAENIMVGAHSLERASFLGDALRLPSASHDRTLTQDLADRLIDTLRLQSVRDTPVSRLPFGTLKRVELGRALASRPTLLLLDEPAGGLNHEEVDHLKSSILALRDEFRLTILLVEHHMNLVMRVSDQVVALDFGRKIADGSPSEVKSNPDVIKAYLGTAA